MSATATSAVRVTRNGKHIRHEFRQPGGGWMPAPCNVAGFCRESIRDGERPALDTVKEAFYKSVAPAEAARIILGAYMHQATALVRDGDELIMTPFTRLRIAVKMEECCADRIPDHAILTAQSVGDVISLARGQG
ncbi:MAG TPA: hypothetical protein VF475_14640 [Sphingobium sp.]